MGFLDSETIEIPCEGCGKEHSKTIGWIKTHSEISCSCGATIKIDKSEFVRGISGVERALDGLMNTRNINIKIGH